MRAGDVVSMGFDPEVIYELDGLTSGSDVTETEVFERQGYDEDYGESDEIDPSMKNVLITEAYMRLDVDSTVSVCISSFVGALNMNF